MPGSKDKDQIYPLLYHSPLHTCHHPGHCVNKPDRALASHSSWAVRFNPQLPPRCKLQVFLKAQRSTCTEGGAREKAQGPARHELTPPLKSESVGRSVVSISLQPHGL